MRFEITSEIVVIILVLKSLMITDGIIRTQAVDPELLLQQTQ